MDRILVLNASFMPLGVVTWMKAICLLWQEKAEVVAEGTRLVRSPSRTMRLPSILRLRRQVPYRRRRLRPTRANLLRRDGSTCQYCGRRLPPAELSIDHVIPRAQGGRTTWTNVVIACRRDNHRKGGRTPAQAGMRLLRDPVAPRWTVVDEIRLAVRDLPAGWEIFLPASRRERRQR